MYGKRLYGRKLPNDLPPAVQPSQPTFLCIKCKAVKQQSIGFTDLSVMENGKVKILGRICHTCVILLETWVKG